MDQSERRVLGTYPHPEHLGAVHPDGRVLPGQKLVDPGAQPQVGRVPAVRSPELLGQVEHDGDAGGERRLVRTNWTEPPLSAKLTSQPGRSLRLEGLGLF